MPIQIDYEVALRLIVARMKQATVPPLMPSEPDPEGRGVHCRLLRRSYRPTRRVSGAVQPDHAGLVLVFGICANAQGTDDNGDGAAERVLTDLLLWLDETPRLFDATTNTSVDLDRWAADVDDQSQAGPGVAFASVTVEGRIKRSAQTGTPTEIEMGVPKA